MKKIFKYPIPITDEFTISTHEGARGLSVQMQRETPCIWALVDPSTPVREIRFRLVGTGHPIDDEEAKSLEYVGTFQMHGGDLVWHLFEVTTASSSDDVLTSRLTDV